MKKKQSGEWIGHTYRVLDVFPFVQGVLYYSAVEGGDWGPDEEFRPTRFILAVGKGDEQENALRLTERDDAAFFPVEKEFVDEGVLYWVFRPLKGDLLAHRLLADGALPLGEVRTFLAALFDHARRLFQKGEYAVVDPLNMLVTADGEIRFLYGGAAGLLPGSGIPDVEKQWVCDIAAFAYLLLTGQKLTKGDSIPPRHLRKDVPALWEVLIRQALSSDPAARPALARLEEGLLKEPEEEGSVPEAESSVPARPETEEVSGSEGDSSLPAVPGNVVEEKAGPASAKSSPIGAETTSGCGEIRRRTAKGPEDGKNSKTGPVPLRRRSTYRSSDDSAERGEGSRGVGRLWKSKGLLAALAAFILLIAGVGGYQWLFAEKESADVKSSAVFDPDVQEDPDQAAEWYRQSVEARNNNQVAQAIPLGKKAVSADPNKRQYYVHLAELYQMAGDPRSAVLLLQEAVKRFPDDAELHDMLAMYAYNAEDLKTAESASDRSVQIEPNNPVFLYHRGKIFIKQGNLRTAAELIKEAVKKDPDNAVYHHDLAVVLFRLEEVDRSVEHAEKAVQQDKSNYKYWMTLGLSYLKKRELLEKDSNLSDGAKNEQQRTLAKKAYESFHTAARLNDRYSQAFYYEAMSRYYYGDLNNAKRAVERAIVLDSGKASYYYQLGVILTAQNNKSEAIKAMEKAVELDPKNALYKDALAKLKSG